MAEQPASAAGSAAAPPAPEASGQKISATALSALTGLTDRRHRQLARDGYFPEPVKSEYLLTPTIRGLFRYYREHNQRTKEKAFETKDSKVQMEMKLLKIRLDRENKRLVLRADVNAMLLNAATLIRNRLYAALEREMPARVIGRTPAEIAATGRVLADELVGILRSIDEAVEELE